MNIIGLLPCATAIINKNACNEMANRHRSEQEQGKSLKETRNLRLNYMHRDGH